jgi:proteasome lid subunit RPN8/RPN11
MRPFSRLILPSWIVDAMVEHARRESPRECCGLLAGVIDGAGGAVSQCFPLRNDLASPTQYRTNARDLLDANKVMRKAKLEPLAIYHSHPASEPVPSRTDLAENTWADSVIHVIVGLQGEIPQLRAWWLEQHGAEEAPIDMVR